MCFLIRLAASVPLLHHVVRRGILPLVLPPCPFGPPGGMSPWDWGSRWLYEGRCCPFSQTVLIIFNYILFHYVTKIDTKKSIISFFLHRYRIFHNSISMRRSNDHFPQPCSLRRTTKRVKWDLMRCRVEVAHTKVSAFIKRSAHLPVMLAHICINTPAPLWARDLPLQLQQQQPPQWHACRYKCHADVALMI